MKKQHHAGAVFTRPPHQMDRHSGMSRFKVPSATVNRAGAVDRSTTIDRAARTNRYHSNNDDGDVGDNVAHGADKPYDWPFLRHVRSELRPYFNVQQGEVDADGFVVDAASSSISTNDGFRSVDRFALPSTSSSSTPAAYDPFEDTTSSADSTPSPAFSSALPPVYVPHAEYTMQLGSRWP
jgi:hypothetical protein